MVSWRLSALVGTAYESTGVAFRQIACGYGITVPLRGSMGASSSLRYENPSLHKPQQIEDFPIPDSPANSNPRPLSAKAAACTKYKSGLSACNAMVISFSIQYARSSRSVQVTARPGRSMLHERIRRSKRTVISSAGADHGISDSKSGIQGSYYGASLHIVTGDAHVLVENLKLLDQHWRIPTRDVHACGALANAGTWQLSHPPMKSGRPPAPRSNVPQPGVVCRAWQVRPLALGLQAEGASRLGLFLGLFRGLFRALAFAYAFAWSSFFFPERTLRPRKTGLRSTSVQPAPHNSSSSGSHVLLS